MRSVLTALPGVLSVWKALFLREAIHRLFGSRAAWAWLFLEPLAHIAFLMFLFSTVRMRVVGGIDTPVWIMVGLLSFFVFKRTATQGMNAIGANKSLFAYRQVKPADTVISRVFLEGVLMLLISTTVIMGAGLFGFDVNPADTRAILLAYLGLWLVGFGFGLIASVAMVLVPEAGSIIALLMTPLYFISGVIFPLAKIPSPYREWLMINPIPHGLESVRHGFAAHYQIVPETSLLYMYGSAIVLIFFGLALHVRFSLRLASK